MLNLFSEIVDLMSESARMAAGERTRATGPALQPVSRVHPGEPLIHRFLKYLACHAAVAEPLG